jgi:hypothetical protein
MREWEIGEGGVGRCPRPVTQERRYKDGKRYVYRGYTMCKCGKCGVCGFPLHSTVHMHASGEDVGGRPFEHRFVPQQEVPGHG